MTLDLVTCPMCGGSADDPRDGSCGRCHGCMGSGRVPVDTDDIDEGVVLSEAECAEYMRSVMDPTLL